ncbi:hypothetical protein IF1G_11130 [Cordyceps javanica]|uniref:Uncharacterized protein n=1 Tax=Cordyceps javanica TaxID=43265 RepID=A0A545UL95_9HYPO|nr:hypothetical protein IF1G_11130 [Cordyceps javanica]
MPLYPISCSFCGVDITSNKDHTGHITNHQEQLSDLQGRLTTVVHQYFEDGYDSRTGDSFANNSAVLLPAMFHGNSASPVLPSRRRYCKVCKRIVPKQHNMARHTYQRIPPPPYKCGKKPINADAYIYHYCNRIKPNTQERKSRTKFVDDKLAEQQRTGDRSSIVVCQTATEGLAAAAMTVQKPVRRADSLNVEEDLGVHASQYHRESIWTQPGRDMNVFFGYGEGAQTAACLNPSMGVVPPDRTSLWQAPM